MKKATKLEDIHLSFRPVPLEIDELREFYVTSKEARGSHVTQRMIRSLQENRESNQHILFAGYKGCGKSTELSLLRKELKNEFLIINFSVSEELDPVSLNYIELFIVTMERLFDLANQRSLEISKEFIRSIENWIRTEDIEEIRQKYLSVEVEGGGGVSFLTLFFAKFKAAAKASKSMKEVLSRKVEPKLSELIEHCNALIREVRNNLYAINKYELLIIIEDLDKIPLDRSHELFYNYSQQLTQLQVNTIFTFPIGLYYNPLFNTIKHRFSNFDILPMIKVKNRDGSNNEKGIQTMLDIVEKRMNSDLFEDKNLLLEMIQYSGGCIRDLFLMIKEAADAARDYNRGRITQDDFQQAYYSLKRDYDANIADKVVDGEVKISVDDYYSDLIKLAEDPKKSCHNSQVVMDLRQNLTILGYNGAGWCDVHPIVRDILKERGKLG